MSIFLEILIAVSAIWIAWRLIRRLLRPGMPADPVDDPFASVPAPRKRGPKGRSGAVALEEPEDDGEDSSFPPRRL